MKLLGVFGRLLNIDRRVRSGDILPALKEMNGGVGINDSLN